MLRLFCIAAVLLCFLSRAFGAQPSVQEIDAFVSKLTPQQQSEQLALARTRITSLAKAAKTPETKRELAELRKLVDSASKKLPLFPVMELPPHDGDIGRLPMWLRIKENTADGDVVCAVPVSSGDPLTVPGDTVGIADANRSIQCAIAKSHNVDIKITGIKGRLAPGERIFDSDLYFAHEVKAGGKKQLIIEKIESEPIVDAWKTTFKKK